MTVTVIAIPGTTAICTPVQKYFLAELNMAPHSGVGGCAPSPKKLKEAAVRMEEPMRKVA